MADTSANHDTQIITVAVVFQTLMLASFSARMISIRLRHNKYHLDDVLLTIALVRDPAIESISREATDTHKVAASLETVVFAIGTHAFGLGHHIKSLTSEQLVWFEKAFFGSGFTQTSALAFAKLSLIILLHRIFVTRAFRITTWVLAAIVIAWYVASVLAGTLNCLPVQSLWNPSIPGHCGNQLHIQIAEPIPWIVTDFAVLVAPLPLVRKLHLPRAQRFGLAGLFLLGGVTCIASCIRYSTVWYSVTDVPWDIAAAACWNIVEADLGVIVVSLIVSRPLLSRLMPQGLVIKIRSTWSKISSSFPHASSRTNLFSTFKRASKNPPALPSFTDSQIEFASKTKDEGSLHLEDMSTRAHLEDYCNEV